MAKDVWSATGTSAIIVPADEHREFLLIEHTNATQVALGFGEDAVATKGVQLIKIGDSVVAKGNMARKAVYAIGNGGTGSYQDGDITFYPGSAAT